MNDGESLKHTKSECKYHLVSIPKYGKKILHGAPRHQLGDLLRELARQCESQVEQGHLLQGHVHMLMLISPKYSVAQVVRSLKGEQRDLHCARTSMRKLRNFMGESLLGGRLFYLHSRTRRESHPGVHPDIRSGRSTNRPVNHFQSKDTLSSFQTQTTLDGSQNQASAFAGSLFEFSWLTVPLTPPMKS